MAVGRQKIAESIPRGETNEESCAAVSGGGRV